VHALLTLVWLLGAIYATIPAFWIAVHPFVGRWRARNKNPFPALVTIWIGMIAAALLLTRPLRELRIYSTALAFIPAVFLFAGAIFIYRRSGHAFGRDNLIGRTELEPTKHEQKLVTTGLHARLRHPIYLGHLLMLTAWTIASGTAAMLAYLVLAIITGTVMIRMEDAELEARFGNDFREYKKRVPAIIPYK
jgi:protein-S-isoprenylcysteine O-methyltransferase Ste14